MDLPMNRVGAVAALSLLVLALVGASGVPLHTPGTPGLSPGGPVRDMATSGLNFDYLVTIIMENHNLCEIYAHCGGTGVYMTALADAYSISLQDSYCNVNPSLPNYLCLSGGTDFGCAGYDGDPNSNNCTNSAWNSENIIDRIVGGGLTWKAYMEGMPSNCYGSDSGNYAVRHNPFVYYSDIANNATRCNQVVPAGTAGSALVSDLASTSTASNYMWFTPDTCNDMHDCDVPTGDAYLSVLVPLILASNVFLTERAALLLTFDEGYGEPIYTVWAGPVVKTAYTSSTAYDHFSVLSTIESNWNLPPLTSNDQNAPNMNEFFTTPAGPDFSLSANPSTVSFVAGDSTTSTITLHSTGGFTGTVALTTSSSPAGIDTTCNPSNLNGNQTSTCTLSGSTPGSYVVSVTGTSGSLTHKTSISARVTAPVGPDFSLSASPSSVTFLIGQSATSTIALHSTGGFNGTVQLREASTPPGVSTSCSPASLQDNQTSTCTLGASGAGSYTVTVTGTNDSLVHTTSIGVTVTAPPTPDFSISATPASVSFVAGQSATSTISVQPSEGFTGTVALTPASSPAGVTASCFPSSISGTQVSTCMLNATAPGSYTVVVTGTSGTLSHATSILVGVTGAGPTARFTFAPSAPVANHSVLFDASSSSDADPNAILGARWDWGGDGRWDTPWSYSLTASHVFTTAGTYAVTLQVLDAYGLVDTTSRSVTVLRPDKIAPQVTILSPPDGAIVGPEDVTVVGTASDNVAIVELSTDNATWMPTAGTTQWSGTIPLKAGTNQIYVRATDTSGNENVVEITVIAEQRPAGLAGIVDPTIPVLLVFASVGALVGAHAFVAGRSRTRRAGPKKKETVVVQPPKSRDPSIPAGKGLAKR